MKLKKVKFRAMKKGILYASPSGLVVSRFRRKNRDGEIKDYLYVWCTDHFLPFSLNSDVLFREIGPYQPMSKFLELEIKYGGKVIAKSIKHDYEYLKKRRPKTIYNVIKRKFKEDKIK